MCRSSTIVVNDPRAGLSLLEVLVACGILVIGLSSIAAILPAAASRLTQAVEADRSGILAANAYAELVNRGMIAADMFSSGTRACVFGRVLPTVTTATTGFVTGSAGAVMAVASGVLASRIDATRGFVLQDDLTFASGTTGSETPENRFESASSSIRGYNEGLCWGAMLACTVTASTGVPATLSIAVFKKDAWLPEPINLTGPPGATTLELTATSNASTYLLGVTNEQTRKRLLPACSYVLATTNPPQWLRVQASWTLSGTLVSGTENPSSRRSFVVLDRNPATSGTLSVVGFDQLLRVDQYPVVLD